MCLDLVGSGEKYVGVTREPASFPGRCSPRRRALWSRGASVLEPIGQLGLRGGWDQRQDGCSMGGQRASEVNFHLENSKGVCGLGVEWKGWR